MEKSKKRKLKVFCYCFGTSQQRLIEGDDSVTSRKEIKAKEKSKLKGKLKRITKCLYFCWKTRTSDVRTVPINVITSTEITPVLEISTNQHRGPPQDDEMDFKVLKDSGSSHEIYEETAGMQPEYCEDPEDGNDITGKKPSFKQSIGSMRTDFTGKVLSLKRVVQSTLVLPRDSVVGVSIVVATALMMVTCGKVWAVIFSIVWLVVLTYFKKSRERVDCQPDYDSVKYKKSVVLQGLLARAGSSD